MQRELSVGVDNMLETAILFLGVSFGDAHVAAQTARRANVSRSLSCLAERGSISNRPTGQANSEGCLLSPLVLTRDDTRSGGFS